MRSRTQLRYSLTINAVDDDRCEWDTVFAALNQEFQWEREGP
jgi:hypothetical protein